MKQRWKRGFTTSELVIFIAVIVILAAVLIPTFIILVNNGRNSNSNDPEVSADITLAKNMNAVLEASGEVLHSMSDAVLILESHGYKYDNLTAAEKGNVFLWNGTTNRISYIEKTGKVLYTQDFLPTVFTSSPEYWLCVRTQSEMEEWGNLSYYFAADITEPISFNGPSNINTGKYMAGDVSYQFEDEAQVKVEGALTSLTIDAPYADVYNYSSVGSVNVIDVGTEGYHEHGYVRGKLSLSEYAQGAVVEAEGTVVELDATLVSYRATVVNRGYVLSMQVSSSVVILNEGYIDNAEELSVENAASLIYTISGASDLSRLRDKINNGIVMKNVTYELTSDINLFGSDWTPMGMENNKFSGTLNGNNHTIDGLTSLSFLGYVEAGTTVRDLKFTNVNTILPPVAACVYGSLSSPTVFSNIQVSGVVSSDMLPMSGLIGLVYSTETRFSDKLDAGEEVVVENCVNNAVVTCVGYNRAAGFVVTSYGVNLVVRDCVNNGTLSVTNLTREAHAGGMVGAVWLNNLLPSPIGDEAEKFTVIIENCTNNGAISATVGTSAANYAGGMVGVIGNGNAQILGCVNNGDVSSRNTVGGSQTAAGGLVGTCYGGDVVLRDCEVRANVSSTGERTSTSVYAGGAIGLCGSACGAATTENVLVLGKISASGQGAICAAGGIVGFNDNVKNRLTVSECTVASSVEVTASGAQSNSSGYVAGKSASSAIVLQSVTVSAGKRLIGGYENSYFKLNETAHEGDYVRYEQAGA